MRKYHGTLVHRSKDHHGTIEIVDDGITRSLHFGNPVRQSAADLSRPEYLVLTYTRAMMSCLLFQPAPRQVLMVGLGGGSLAKFILHHFPHCSLDAIEHRELVVSLAHGYFQLPEDRRLRIHVADGVEYVENRVSAGPAQYDLILIDAYHEGGMDDNMGEQRFLHSCRTLLSRDGLLAINLWGRDRARFHRTRQALQRCFGARPLLLPAEGTTNVIALALNCAASSNRLKTMATHANSLEDITGLELKRLSRMLRKHNGSLLQRIFL
jgi:spermidine synthase